jgi:hypothetical protein
VRLSDRSHWIWGDKSIQSDHIQVTCNFAEKPKINRTYFTNENWYKRNSDSLTGSLITKENIGLLGLKEGDFYKTFLENSCCNGIWFSINFSAIKTTDKSGKKQLLEIIKNNIRWNKTRVHWKSINRFYNIKKVIFRHYSSQMDSRSDWWL